MSLIALARMRMRGCKLIGIAPSPRANNTNFICTCIIYVIYMYIATMDDTSSSDSLVKLDSSLIKSRDYGVGGTRERDGAAEKRMKELLRTTRGLLLHFPSSCRFNNEEDEDWNTYVRGALLYGNVLRVEREGE